MELFVVKNRAGQVVIKDQASKSVAKGARDELQAKHGKMPDKAERDSHKLWDFHVARGKDHLHAA